MFTLQVLLLGIVASGSIVAITLAGEERTKVVRRLSAGYYLLSVIAAVLFIFSVALFR